MKKQRSASEGKANVAALKKRGMMNDFIKKICKSEEKRVFSLFFERKAINLQKNCKYQVLIYDFRVLSE